MALAGLQALNGAWVKVHDSAVDGNVKARAWIIENLSTSSERASVFVAPLHGKALAGAAEPTIAGAYALEPGKSFDATSFETGTSAGRIEQVWIFGSVGVTITHARSMT